MYNIKFPFYIEYIVLVGMEKSLSIVQMRSDISLFLSTFIMQIEDTQREFAVLYTPNIVYRKQYLYRSPPPPIYMSEYIQTGPIPHTYTDTKNV